MSQTVMITGGTGYIGVWLTKMLLEAGHTVAANADCYGEAD